MIALFFVFFTLCIIALAAPFLAVLSSYEGTIIQRIEGAISDHNGIILSIGTVVLVSLIGLLAAVLTNHGADRRERSNRLVTSELKLAEFRQQWINELREDFARLGRLVFHRSSIEEVKDAYALMLKVEMRLNMEEEISRDLISMINILHLATESEAEGFETSVSNAYASLCNRLLKKEWERLKTDIRNAQILEKIE